MASALLVALFADAEVALAQVAIGDRIHITGCENGQLQVAAPNLWDSPAQRRIIGQLSGDGRADQGLRCQGSVVIVRAIGASRGRTFYRVETVVGDRVGWISELFIGRTFDTALCASFFDGNPEAIRKCTPADPGGRAP